MRTPFQCCLLLLAVALALQAQALQAQIVVDPSPTVLLSGRDTNAIVVAANGTGSIAFTADPASSGGDIFDVSVSDPAVGVSLLLPNNVEVTPANATSLGFTYVLLPQGSSNGDLIPSTFSIPGTHKVFVLPAGQSGGTYTVKIDATGVASQVIAIASYFSSSKVRSALVTGSPLYKIGDTVLLFGLLYDNATPVTGATVTARIGDPSNSTSTPAEVALLDSGTYDGAPNDGVYTGSWAASAAGRYTAAMKATGTSSGHPFSRTAATSFRVLPLTALFGSFSDSGVDDNGNGLFDRIVVTPTVNVHVAGNYRFGISMSSGSVTLTGGDSFKLPAGTSQISVSFSAAQVLTLGKDGPYKLTNATLMYLDDPDSPAVDFRADVGMTQAYKLTSLDQGNVYFDGQNSVTPMDTNGNGKYDILRVTAGVSVSTGGSYQWSARLVDVFGHEIDFFGTTEVLNAGVSTVTFDFSGAKIGQNARNGPYYVRAVLMSGPAGSVVVNQLTQTPAYSVLQFENAKCPGDVNGDNAVDTSDLNLVKAAFGHRANQPGYNSAADINLDGIVDVLDLSYVAQNVGCRIQ